jgi:tRNA(Ile)-lysidine synthase
MKVSSPHFRPFAKRGLYERFQRTCKTLRLSPTETVLVGLSGGRDSVVLLHLLLAHGFAVVAAHLNHQLRGRESNSDEVFVKNLCKKWNVPLWVERMNVRSLAKKHRLSVEEAARIARYRFFAQCAKRKKLKKILVAHHERDQAETILLKIFQGTTREYLAGMKMKRPLPQLEWHTPRTGMACRVSTHAKRVIELIRPLLDTPFEEVVLYAKQNKLRCREDSSNRDLTIQRNWIRHQLLPLIEKKLNRNVVKTLARLARV